MSDLVQASFDIFEGFNYEALPTETREFVIQKTDETHGLLKRTAENIIKVGQNLIAVKEKIGHGNFLPWLKAEFDMSDQSARNFIHVAEKFGNNDKFKTVLNLSPKILYELAAPSTKDEIVNGVLSGEIDPTLEAIKREKEALKKADESEKAKQKAEQMLTLFEQQSQSQEEEITSLTSQIKSLEQSIRTISKPQVIKERVEVEKLVIPPKDKAEMDRMKRDIERLKEEKEKKEAQFKERTQQRDNLAEEREKLEKKLDTYKNEEQRLKNLYEVQLHQRWSQACDTFDQGIRAANQLWPNPIDAQRLFDDNDWALFAQMRNQALQYIEALDKLANRTTDQFVDASIVDAPIVDANW
jgi:hypothetical protein